jgi:hypothetical protein
VFDSGGTDGTLAALAHFPNVRVFNRRFDTHGKQCRYATEKQTAAPTGCCVLMPTIR